MHADADMADLQAPEATIATGDGRLGRGMCVAQE
jgi:hypothetical protein